MANKYLSDMPVVNIEDVKPLYSGDDVVQKLATAVNGLRSMDRREVNGGQLMELEMMYSLAIYIRDKK